jgi:hypothetical protein
MKNEIIPIERVENKIYVIRSQRVMIDSDLAEIYGVTTKRLNEQVKRNRKRFPKDFMFALTKNEKAEVVANCDHLQNLKFSPVLPFVFTEHGAVMLASVLNSQTAVEASILVVRAFIQLRKLTALNANLAIKVAELEAKYGEHDEKMKKIIKLLKDLLTVEPPKLEPEPEKDPIGFRVRK